MVVTPSQVVLGLLGDDLISVVLLMPETVWASVKQLESFTEQRTASGVAILSLLGSALLAPVLFLIVAFGHVTYLRVVCVELSALVMRPQAFVP